MDKGGHWLALAIGGLMWWGIVVFWPKSLILIVTAILILAGLTYRDRP